MRLLKRRVRAFFAFQAILLYLAGLRCLLQMSHLHQRAALLHTFAFFLGYLLLSLVFTKAWRTTLRPTAILDGWATAAGLVCLAAGLALSWIAHARHTFEVNGVIAIAIGVGTFVMCARPRSLSPSEPEAAPEPAESPDSPAFAADPDPTPHSAAVLSIEVHSQPGDGPWDPLQFIRTPAILDKLRQE